MGISSREIVFLKNSVNNTAVLQFKDLTGSIWILAQQPNRPSNSHFKSKQTNSKNNRSNIRLNFIELYAVFKIPTASTFHFSSNFKFTLFPTAHWLHIPLTVRSPSKCSLPCHSSPSTLSDSNSVKQICFLILILLNFFIVFKLVKKYSFEIFYLLAYIIWH